MLRIAIADIHLSEYKDDKSIESLPRRLYDIKITLEKIIKFAKDNKIKNIDILGDIYHDKNIIYTDCQNLFKDIILSNSDIHFTIISGNHDLSSEGENQTSAIETLDILENVTCVIKEPYKEENMVFVPYSNNFIEYLQDIEEYDILLSHFGVSEAVLQSGISIRSNINMNDLKKFKLILLGHYHKPQEIIKKTHKLYYIGSLIHHNWNDKNEQKRFIVYDTEKLEIESVPITWITEFKELILENEEQQKLIFEQANILKEKGDIVRIRKKIDKISKEYQKDDLIIVDDIEEDLITNRGITSNISHEEKFKKYLKYKNIEDEKDVEKYLDIAFNIINGNYVFKDNAERKENEISQTEEVLDLGEITL